MSKNMIKGLKAENKEKNDRYTKCPKV